MKLSRSQLEFIQEQLSNERFRNHELKEELFDHLCSVAEEKYAGNGSFKDFVEKETQEIAPHGLKQLEVHTNYASYSKPFIGMKKLTYTTGLLASVSLATGILFKLMMWPGATMLLLIGVVLLFLVFIPYMAYEGVKSGVITKGMEKTRVLIGVFSSVLIGLSVIFKFLHFRGASIVLVLGMALFIVGFLPLFFIKLYKNNTPSTQKVD
jgi:hypothetical protein